MKNLYLKFGICLAVTLVIILLFFNLLSFIMRPALSNEFVMPSAERIAEVEELRHPKPPPIIYQKVDYSEGKKGAWYPKGEAPILKELIAEGKLPPLNERVPTEPLVLEGVDHVHNYGGTWMRLGSNASEVYCVANRLGYAHIVRWSPMGKPIVPHVAKNFTVSDDNRVYTFELRKGMKWSDGHPYNTDDIKYNWEMEENDPMLASSPSQVYRFQGKLAKIEFLDKYNFKITFDKPNPLFLPKIAGAYGRWLCNSPAHFLKRFHPRIGDQKLIEKLQDKYGLPSAKSVYRKIKDVTNPELPRITPWIIKRPVKGSPSEAVRNPYYFVVDSAGNQLPYLDRIIFTARSSNMITLSAASGEVSMQNKKIDPSQYTLLMGNSQKEGYQLYHWTSQGRSNFTIYFNLEYKVNPDKPETKWLKKTISSKEFRRAMSISIDRQRMIDSEFNGIVEAAQLSPSRSSYFFNEEVYKSATEYDPETACKLLDNLGLSKRDSEGYRTFPDGSHMSIYFSIPTPDDAERAQFVVDDWKRVGVRVIIRVLGLHLMKRRVTAGEAEMFLSNSVIQFFPLRPCFSFAPGVDLWYEAGGMFGSKDSESLKHKAPPKDSDLYKSLKYYSEAKKYSDPAKQKIYLDKMLQIVADNVWQINIATPLPVLAIVKDGFKNVPRDLSFAWSHQSPANGGVETFCWEKEYLQKKNILEMDEAAKESIKYQIVNTTTDKVSDSSVDNYTPKGIGKLTQDAKSVKVSIALNIVKYLLIGIALLFLSMAALKHPYILRRLALMVPTLFIISILVFVVIQLPPGDYIDTKIAAMEEVGEEVDAQEIEQLKAMFFIDDSMAVRYARWMGLKWFISFDNEDRGLLQGHMGRSMRDMRVVNELIAERVILTFFISLGTLLFTWAIAFPVGIYSAVKQYSFFDYVFTVFGFLGMSIPGFISALLMMYACERFMGFTPTGLFSSEFGARPDWNWDKIIDLLKHVWIPVMIMGVAGTAGMIRVMRANLLDELKKPYVITAKAKGVRPLKLLFKYPVRMALNPFVSGIGGIFPRLVSGGAIVAIVMSLPTVGPLLLEALLVQDMYMAGSLIMFFSLLGIFGVLVSDLLLLVLDPRIRFGGGTR